MSDVALPIDRRERILNAICYALIIVVVTIAFGRLFGADFTNWDDSHTVAENEDFQPASMIRFGGWWTEPRAHLYVPVTYTVWWAISLLTQENSYGQESIAYLQNPHVFHAANIVLHALAACVAFVVLRRLVNSRWPALIGALIFALHPVQVEPVGWVSGLKDVLCGLLTFVALWQYISYAQSARTRPYVICCFAFIAAMLSKPTAAMFPIMALAVDAFALRRKLPDIVRGIVPLVLFAGPILFVARYFQDASKADTIVAPHWRPIVALDAIAFYLGKIAWPINLALDYGRHPRALLAGGAWRWTIVIPIILTIALIAIARRNRSMMPLLAGAILFVAPLLPVLGLVPFDFQQYSTVADHYLYMPMMGIALIIAIVLERAARNKIAIGFAALVCLALAVRTFDQTRHWMNSETLWTRAIAINPNSWVSYLDLGEHYVDHDQTDRAIPMFERSIALRDNDPAHLNLGAVYLERGDLPRAMSEFQRSLRLRRTTEGHTNLANVYGQLGRIDDAINEYKLALQVDPDNDKAKRMLIRAEGYRRHLQTRPSTTTRSSTTNATRSLP